MVGGDRLSYGIHLGIDTQALITTAAAAKIYRDHPVPAEVTGQIHLEAGAWLEWLPQETIVFEGARYHSTWRVDLAVGAHWVGWEVFRLGRTARKERFCQGEVRSRLEVWQNNSLLWIDPQHLEGSETLWQSAHALNCCPVLGTFAYIGTLPEPTLVAAARLAWQDLPTPAGESGVTRLTRGMLCRYRGHSTTAARRWFTAVWQLVRPLYTCQTPVAPRVWQIF
jgi:urease accessory protein